MKKLKNGLKNVRIKTKIILIYISVLIISFLLSYSSIFLLNAHFTTREVGTAGIQTVGALDGNLKLLFDNVTQLSDLIYFDEDIQNSLRGIRSSSVDSSVLSTIKDSLINMILSGDYISGVYIIDRYGNFYDSYKLSPQRINKELVKDTGWFREANTNQGEGFFIHKSEGVIVYFDDRDYITYVRQIRDKNTYRPLATLLVTIDTATIQEYFSSVSDKGDNTFCIIDADGGYLVSPDQHKEDISSLLLSGETGTDGYRRVGISGQEYIMTEKAMDIDGWKLVGLFPIAGFRAMAPYYTSALFLVVCLNIVFIFACSMALTRMIFNPLSKVESHMLMVEQGEFVTMEVDDSRNEISNLKNVFNHMTESIQNLIEKVKEEEKIIARGELDLLQAQINPHFLYNTLDAVSALALMEDYRHCFEMTQALGRFYRNSLNSGKTLVTVREEIECIRSYLTILNIRYEDKLTAEYDVEEGLLDVKILKLLLQPLVENAVHHGIKGNEGSGHIGIRIFSDGDEIILMVSDDGAGMTEERIREILEGKTVSGKHGFGLAGLRQRVTLFYGIENPLIIHSEPGIGTEVAVRIRRQPEESRKDGDQRITGR